MPDSPPPVAVRLARAMRRDVVTPEADRARRRIAIVGRGIHLGLDLVPDVALVRITEHGQGGVGMLPGTLVAEVWGGELEGVHTMIERCKPAGVQVVAVWRPATRWVRLVAWWRYFVDELAGRWPERIRRARGRAR